MRSGRRADATFTTRAGGVSKPPYDTLNLGGGVGDDPAAVAANRRGWPPRPGCRPTAGLDATGARDDRDASRPDGSTGRAERCDGSRHDGAGLALAVLVADCVPILAADPVAGVIAAVHAGRRGAAAGSPLRTATDGCRPDAAADQIEVLLGPAICGGCYEVPASMRDEVGPRCRVRRAPPTAGHPGWICGPAWPRQLRGRRSRRVVIDKRCTYTDADLFSHRRGAPTGRLAGSDLDVELIMNARRRPGR